jgi:hypothetical protein
MNFPTFVYKSPGPHNAAKGGKTYGYIVVEDEQEFKQKLAEGWFATSDEAMNPKAADPVPEPVENVAPPNRAELESMARELGVKFDRRTSDKKLLQLIDQKLEA